MESKHRDILQRRLPDIRRDLRVDYVIPQLIERSILLAPMERDINSKESHEERADELIGLLQTRGRNAFAVFCEILRETYPDLADMLQEESSDTSQPRSTLHGGFAPVPAAMTSASTSRSQISVLPASLPIQLSTRRGPSLFIIHAGEDKKSFVRPLHKALLGQKLHEEEIFLDEVSINTGENISDKIMSTLASESLKLVTIVMSNHLLDKYWPRLEYELSLFHQKKFYPIWLDQNTDSFEAFSRKVGSRFPMLKKTLAHRIQYDNIAEDITDVAIKIVQLLSDQCHTGTKRKRQTSEQSREGFGQIKDLSKVSGNVTEDMSGVGTDTEIPWAIPELKARLELIINSPDLTPEAAERIAEIERKLFTPTVLNDPQVYWQVFRTFLGHSAVILKTSIGSLLLILSFFRINDVDKFYHTYSGIDPGSLSVELSKLLVSKDCASAIGERSSERLSVRIHVEHGDYQAIRNRLRKGLVRSTSLGSLLYNMKPKEKSHAHYNKCLDALHLASAPRSKMFNGWKNDMGKLLQQSAQERRQLKAKLEIAKHQASENAAERDSVTMQMRYLSENRESLQDQLQKTKEQMTNELKEKQEYVEDLEKDKKSMQERIETLESQNLKLENRLALVEDTEEPADAVDVAPGATSTDPQPEPVPTGDELGKALLEAFAPLLRETVIPGNIIVHLMGYTGIAFVRTVLAVEQNKGPSEAMQTLLVKLQTFEQPGWFQAFLDSLDKSGYSHIKEIMEGRDTIQDMTGFKRLLQLWAPQLQVVVAMEMLPHLPCLSDQDKEQIQTDHRTYGNCRALITLIDRVTRCEPGWYTQFLQGLRRNQYDELAAGLEDIKTAPERVQQKSTHEVAKKKLKVRMVKPRRKPPVDPSRILLKGVADHVHEETLFLYLEAMSRGEDEPSEVFYGKEAGTVMVAFAEPISDLDTLLSRCEGNELEEHKISAERVHATDCIQVTGIPPKASKDILYLYFENAKRSGGGALAEVELDKDRGTALVFFDDHTVIERVLKQSHTIQKTTVTVEPFYTCLGATVTEAKTPPQLVPLPITENVHSAIASFVMTHRQFKKDLEDEMEEANASISWPFEGDTSCVVITPKLTKESQNLVAIAKNWAPNARKGLANYMARFDTKEISDVMRASWPQVHKLADSGSIKDDDTISVRGTSDRKINFIGLKDSVAKHYQTVWEGKEKIEEDIKRKQSEVDETVTSLKPDQVELLAMSDFINRMTSKFPKLQMSFDTSSFMVKFHGLVDEIQQTKVKMYETVQGIISQPIKLSSTLISFLTSAKEPKKHLLGEYKQGGVVAVITTTTSEVEVCGLGDGDVRKAVSILKKTFQEKCIDVSDQSSSVLDTEEWKTTKTGLEQSAQGLLKISVENSAESGATKILFTGESAIVKDIMDRVDSYLKVKTVYKKQVKAEDRVIRLIKEHHAAHLQLEKLEKDQVSVWFEGSEESPIMFIKGNAEGLQQADPVLKSYIDSVISDQMSIKKPGMFKHFKEDAGRSTDTFAKQFMPMVPKEKALVNLDGGKKLVVWRDDITKHETDVIVNAANAKLEHTGGLAKAIIDAGGDIIQNVCSRYIQTHGTLIPGQVVASPTGLINTCQMILHAVGPIWTGGRNGEEDYLADAVYGSLEEAAKNRYRSIAIPAISTGIYGYPLKKCAETIVATTVEYLEGNPNSSLEVIEFVNVDDKTTEAFVDALVSEFGEDRVEKSDDKVDEATTTPPQGTWSNRRRARGREPRPASPSTATPFTPHQQSRDPDFVFRTTEGKAIIALIANIASQRVDVLVNTIAGNLELNYGAVSKAILQRAGSNLQTLVNKAKQSAGIKSLPDGQILVTGSADLPCNQVIHCVLCSWDGGQGNSEKVLRKIVQQCLQQAEKENYTSIAIPPMGTGRLHFPHDVVAEAMFNEAVEHCRTNPSGSLRDIRFIVREGDQKSVSAFSEVMTKYKALHTDDAPQPTPPSTLDPTPKAEAAPSFSSATGRGRRGRRGLGSRTGHGPTIVPQARLNPDDTAFARHEKITPLQVAKSPPEQWKLKDIPMRGYQMELAIPALEGRNTIICAPTGSGKTRVAIEITRDHLEGATAEEGAGVDAQRRVVFLVNKVPLVEQQHNAFREYLSPKYDILPLSGEAAADIPHGETLPDYDVIILTAQVLENALRDELITLEMFSLLIFDECHHCQKNDPYNAIMTRYIKQKVEKSGTRLPQIIGLTASLGVGKAKSLKDAVEHILKACANLDAEWISQVVEHKAELQIYNQKPDEETKAVSGRIEDPFADMINTIMDDIEKTLATEASKHLTPEELKPPRQREKQAYEQWVVALARKGATLKDDAISRTIHAATTHLRKYTDALAINADARTKDALQYLDKFVTGLQNEGFDGTDEDLVKHFIEARGKLQEYAADPKYSNPKLDQLRYMILKAYEEKPDSRCLLFCKTRALTIALLTWMKEDPALCKLNPGRLVGAGASESTGGMTQNQQVELLELFTTGGRKIVISTSVAEEGIDIAKCNFVFRYDYVGNEIGKVQTRGRGRAEGSKSVLIAGREGGNVLKEKLNTIRERLMEKAMLHVWHMQRDKHGDFMKEVQRLQDESKKERDLAQALKELERKTKKVHGRGMKLLCVKCKEFACNVSDFRKIKEVHHVVVEKSFPQRIIIRPHPPKKIDDWEMNGKVYCRNCRQDWGIQMVYRKASFPTLKIESFVLEKPDGTRLTCRKWKKAPFDVEDITPDDISGMLKTPEEDSSEEEEEMYY